MRNFRVPALFFVAASSIGAGTPDGQTPAVEDVCDPYSGSAYGLCNAYCEAMDCDDPAANASEEACDAVAENFYNKTGGDVLPCEIAVGC
jgi:hypothetical protein